MRVRFFKELPGNNPKEKPFELELDENSPEVKFLAVGDRGAIFKIPIKRMGHRRDMALKSYGDGHMGHQVGDPVSQAVYALEIHRALKMAGIKTFKTFRISEDKNYILMTLATTEKQRLLPTNGFRMYQEKIGKIENITNIDGLIYEIIANANQAAEGGIDLPGDAYLFFVSQDENPLNKDCSVGFLIGDLDRVLIRKESTSEYKISLRENNIDAGLGVLRYFIHLYVAETKEQEYLDRLEEYTKGP